MNARNHLRRVKYELTKLFGWPDNGRSIRVFENMVNETTWAHHDEVLENAELLLRHKEKYESEGAYEKSSDPIVRQGYNLKKKLCAEFKDKYASTKDLRILIHAPDERLSPGGYSHAHNFQQAFSFVGIACTLFNFGENTEKIFTEFQPTLFLTVDSAIYLKTIDWAAITKYRNAHPMALGVVVQPLEWNEKMPERIAWAQSVSVDFYYAFHDADFISTAPMYAAIRDAGYRILSLPFAANILTYYPVPGIARDVPYAFLGSLGGAKSIRYIEYLGKIVKKYSGFIDGPGWYRVEHFSFNPERDRYVYARAKVGLNIHIAPQLTGATETNERTFMLAACGVPQITDRAKILSKLYSDQALCIADTPQQYFRYFKMIIGDPAYGRERALQAQKETFEKHTTFHRVEAFIKDLQKKP